MPQFPTFKEFLTDFHTTVMSFEKKALEALDKGDTDTYKKYMLLKAEKMVVLEYEAHPYLKTASEAVKSYATKVVKSFSADAKLSLKMDSPFYWSALLWEEDAKPGDPDCLETFIKGLPE